MHRTAAALAFSALVGGAAMVHGLSAAGQEAAQQNVPISRIEPQQKGPVARTDFHGDRLPEGALVRVGTTRLRADASVNVIAFSPDGRRLAYGSESGIVHVCQAADGKPLFELQPGGHFRPVTELAFSPDGGTLAVSGYWLTAVWLIDVATRKVKHTIPNTTEGHGGWARLWQGPTFAFTPDGRTLVVGGKDGAMHLWDTATGKEQAALPVVKERPVGLTLSADGQTALTAHYGGVLHLWDVSGRKHLRKLAVAAKHPHLAALAPNGKTVVLAMSDTELELWDALGGKQHQLRTTAPVVGLGFTPDETSLLVAQGDGNVTTWQVGTGKKQTLMTCDGIKVGRVDARMGPALSAWFRADGKGMAWSVGAVIRPWNLVTKQETPKLAWYRQGVRWAGFSADGRLLHVAGANELGVWDAATGRQHRPPRAADLTAFIPATDRTRVVAVTQSHAPKTKPNQARIVLWDPAVDEDPVPLREQVGPVLYGALTPDNRFIVTTEAEGPVRIYDAKTGRPTRSFDGRKYEYRPTFSPDGTLLATTASEWTIWLYDFASGRVLQKLKGASPAHCLAFSRDGRWLATGHSTPPLPGPQERLGDLIYLWDTASGRELRRIATAHHSVEGLCFSPDGLLIASCGFDRTVRLWEAATGQERHRFYGHRNWVQSVDFDPDGRRLASASLDGTALVWQVFQAAPAKRSAAELESLWADLAKDGKSAQQAMAGLIAARGTPALLKARLKPAVHPPQEQVESSLADLASPVFKKRDAAHRELARLGELVEPALQRALKTATDEEVRRRLTSLVDAIPRPETRPEQLRDLRAVEVLGHLDSDEARGVLADLSKGAPEANLTRLARASIARQARK